MKSYLKSEVEKSVKLGEIECFTADQIRNFTTESYNEINKSIDNDSKEKQINEVALEVKSFSPIEVTDDVTLKKSIQFIRPSQIVWDTPEGDNIEKSRTGKYLNTDLNRKLGRVGKRYEPIIVKNMKTNIEDNVKSEEFDIEKGKRAFIGEVRIYGGVPYKKVSSTGDPNKDWQKVKDSGKTKKEEDKERQIEIIKESHKMSDVDYEKRFGLSKEQSKKNIKENYPDVYEVIWGKGEEFKLDKIVEPDKMTISGNDVILHYGDETSIWERDTDAGKVIYDTWKHKLVGDKIKGKITSSDFDLQILGLKTKLKDSKNNAIIAATNSYKHSSDTLTQMLYKIDVLDQMKKLYNDKLDSMDASRFDTEFNYEKYREIRDKLKPIINAIIAYRIAELASSTLQEFEANPDKGMTDTYGQKALFSDARGLIQRAQDYEKEVLEVK